MATALLQVRLEESLKNEAAQIFESLGIDTSTAIRMFLKRAVMDRGIPFSMTLPVDPSSAERGLHAMKELSESAAKNGLSDMTLNEVNAEIEASSISRKNRKTDI